MESKGTVVIINVDEPLNNLETALVNHIRAMLDALIVNHSRLGVAVFSKGMIETAKIVVPLIKTKEE